MRLDKTLEIQPSFLSRILNLSGVPLDTQLCLDVSNHFEGYPDSNFEGQTRVFIYKKPVDKSSDLKEDDLVIVNVDKQKCISAMSGMTLIALGPGQSQFFTESFYDGLLKSGKFNFMKPDSNTINYSLSGSQLFINGTEVGGHLEEIRPGEFVYFANMYKDTVDFQIVKKLVVSSRVSIWQTCILAFVVFSIWFLIVAGLIENGEKLLKFIYQLLTWKD